MEYSTRVGMLDIADYNQDFRDYVNSNLTTTVENLKLLQLPVLSAGELLLLQDKTPNPTKAPSPAPSARPTLRPVTATPTGDPTTEPSTGSPTTAAPSTMPSEYDFVVVDPPAGRDNSFGLGLGLGLAGAFAVSAMALFFYHRFYVSRHAAKARDDLPQNPTHSTEAYHHDTHQYGGNGRESPSDVGAAPSTDALHTLELAPNEEGRYHGGRNYPDGGHNDHHVEHRVHHEPHRSLQTGSGDALGPDETSPGVDPGPPQQPSPPRGTTAQRSPSLRGALARTPRGSPARSPPRQPPTASPHGTPPKKPAGLPRTPRRRDNDHRRRFSHDPPVVRPSREEAIDSILSRSDPNDVVFAPTESTSPGDNARAAVGGEDRDATNIDAEPHPDDYNTSTAATQSALANSGDGNHFHHMFVNDECFSSGSEVPANEAYYAGSGGATIDDDWLNPGVFDGSFDELDNYKNRDLEEFRSRVEDAIEGAEGMMGLAVTKSLTVPEEENLDNLPWAGARDNGSIEASCLWETYDWLKRWDEHSSLDSVNEYFQDILNRMVTTIMFGMMSPLQGAELVHGCAAILGLDLVEQPPATTLVITGMRKTNDLSQGHNFIVKAFKPFGKIEEAAIAPNNRGFGFVRFSELESVQRALKKYRESEIEIQDVSVSIKTLKSERPRRRTTYD